MSLRDGEIALHECVVTWSILSSELYRPHRNVTRKVRSALSAISTQGKDLATAYRIEAIGLGRPVFIPDCGRHDTLWRHVSMDQASSSARTRDQPSANSM